MLNREPEYMFNKNIEIVNLIKDNYISTLQESNERDNTAYNQIGVKNPFIAPKKEKKKIDLQFLPESGNYTFNTNSVIAFKAIDESGLGVDITGDIYYKESIIASFKSSHLGMGRVNINIPKEGDLNKKDLYAIARDSSGTEVKTNLPIPVDDYVSINLNRGDNFNLATIQNNIPLQTELELIIFDGTEILFSTPINNSKTAIKILDSNCPTGINNIAVVDKMGNVYAQRTFFIYPDNLKLNLKSNKESYKAREKVEYTFNLENKQAAKNGNFSVTVMDNFYAKYSGLNNNIVSYLLMNSELKGYVEAPQYYFCNSIPINERTQNIDLVMLTHGWCYYDLPKILTYSIDAPSCGKEYNQTIQGYVRGTFKNAKESIVSFVAPSINFTAMGGVESSGYFLLTDLNFPDSTTFTVSAVTNSGGTRRFIPYIDNDIFAIDFTYPQFLKAEKYSQKFKDDILLEYFNYGADMYYTLEPIYVRGSRVDKTQNISPFPNYEFKPEQYRGEQELEPYSGYDILTYITTTCPPLKFADTTKDGFQYIVCRTNRVSSGMDLSSGWTEIKVYINGIEQSCSDLSGMTIDEIEGFAYIKSNEASRFNFSAEEATSPKSVILIKTKLKEYGKAINVTQTTPIGWQRHKKIYSPKYATEEYKKAEETLRSTLYWNPSIKLKEGKADFSFYTSDSANPYTIIIEGVLNDGTPIFMMDKIERRD